MYHFFAETARNGGADFEFHDNNYCYNFFLRTYFTYILMRLKDRRTRSWFEFLYPVVFRTNERAFRRRLLFILFDFFDSSVFQLTRTTTAAAAARRTETDEITGRWPWPCTTPVVRSTDNDERWRPVHRGRLPGHGRGRSRAAATEVAAAAAAAVNDWGATVRQWRRPPTARSSKRRR